MSGPDDAARERSAARLRQRLWGAAVLIALAVIVLPLLLDGSGSESQFRRVEKLREEPPRIVGAEGEAPGAGPSVARTDGAGAAAVAADATGERAAPDAPGSDARPAPDIRVGEDDPPDYFRERAAEAAPASRVRRPAAELPSAWVVQAGSFRDRENAVAVLDRLRRAGHATFVTDASETETPLYRVRVGPMVDRALAERLREEIASLLGREAIVVAYP